MLLTGEPEAGVEVTQHVLVLARLPDVMNGVGQLLPLYPGQLLLLERSEGHIGDRAPRVRRGSLWIKKCRTRRMIKIERDRREAQKYRK